MGFIYCFRFSTTSKYKPKKIASPIALGANRNAAKMAKQDHNCPALGGICTNKFTLLIQLIVKSNNVNWSFFLQNLNGLDAEDYVAQGLFSDKWKN